MHNRAAAMAKSSIKTVFFRTVRGRGAKNSIMNWQFRYLLTQQMFATGAPNKLHFIALHVHTYAGVRMQMFKPLISS